jgi:hypothetical protein
MTRAQLLLLLILLSSVSLLAQRSRWPRYVRKAEREEIVSKAMQNYDLTHTTVNIYWVTDSLARADVSDAIDTQHWTNTRAEQEYRRLRAAANDIYIFRIFIGLLGRPIYATPSMGENVDPLNKATLVMRRGNEVIKGTVGYRSYNHSSQREGMQDVYYYVVSFKKRNQTGETFIKDMDDNITVEFEVINEKVDFSYNVNDLATRLQEL